ncbi:MAG: inositol monophosphatase family protein [Candidatus Micrarchaeaceae archaeon]
MQQEDIVRYSGILKLIESELRALRGTIVDRSGSAHHIKKLNPYDLLTELDVAIEDKITSKLYSLTLDVPIVGEERGGDRSARRHWLIDPIDGTIHFVRGNPFYCFMIALIVDGTPVVSMIYNFATDDSFHAIKGGGAYLNGSVLRVSPRPTREAVIHTEVNLHSSENLVLQKLLFEQFRLVSLFCPGYEFSMIAAGRAEGRICIDPFGKDYDFAPGALLVQEAGGVAKNLFGDDYRTSDSDIIVASSMEVYDALLSNVQRARQSTRQSVKFR